MVDDSFLFNVYDIIWLFIGDEDNGSCVDVDINKRKLLYCYLQ